MVHGASRNRCYSLRSHFIRYLVIVCGNLPALRRRQLIIHCVVLFTILRKHSNTFFCKLNRQRQLFRNSAGECIILCKTIHLTTENLRKIKKVFVTKIRVYYIFNIWINLTKLSIKLETWLCFLGYVNC